MPIIKDENNTMQVEFGAGDTIPLTLGLPTEDGRVIPAIVILPMHEAMMLNDAQAPKRKFNEFDIRMIFTNMNQIDFFQMQLEEARRILSLSEVDETEKLHTEDEQAETKEEEVLN